MKQTWWMHYTRTEQQIPLYVKNVNCHFKRSFAHALLLLQLQGLPRLGQSDLENMI